MAELDDDMAMADQESPALPPAAALGLQQPRTPPRPPPWAHRVEQEALRQEAEAIVAKSAPVTALHEEVAGLELQAALARTQQQVVLLSFFFHVPLIQLSGAIAPIESMPTFFRVLSFFDPLRHYVTIARSLILKGVGLEVLLPEVLILLGFAVVLLGLSISRFRAQLN